MNGIDVSFPSSQGGGIRSSLYINCRVRCAYQSRALAVRLVHEHLGVTMVRTAYPTGLPILLRRPIYGVYERQLKPENKSCLL